ncbi:GNAT family N-acetyltransferase [Bosea sp. R86505]|uniref:GNAT family N-acetyltransferase n=1 Tax=Bosea sp. R86505 TaxID=3101710 RepID=UPI00366B429B
MANELITLAECHSSDLATFKRELQDAFAVAVIDEFGDLPDGPIPSDEDLNDACTASGSVVLRILLDGQKIGGAVVMINQETQRNRLDLLFVKTGYHGRGLGLKAWLAIEKRYEQTRIWQTHTPYFEKRNIHFYVNKCGFEIIEFYNKYHPDPHRLAGAGEFPGDDDAFQFEKIMRTE